MRETVSGGAFILESVVRYTALVRYLEFGGCSIFGSRKCIASTGIAVGTSTVVRYMQDVSYWEGPLSEVPLYTYHQTHTSVTNGIPKRDRHVRPYVSTVLQAKTVESEGFCSISVPY